MKTRSDVAKMAFVRSVLPSRILVDGDITNRAEAYGKVTTEDLNLACTYKKACAKAASEGLPFPTPPISLSGLAMDFFTDISISSKPMQHSQAAANSNRQDVYACHNSNSKAHIWFTVSPADDLIFTIVWYALGPDDAEPYKDQMPSGEFRFKLLATNPAAAALHFERVLEIVIERIIGWDRKNGRPHKGGGLFGIPKAWLRVVEEQSRLTLHAHFLIWIYGHANLQDQLREALEASQIDDNLQLLQPTDSSNSSFSYGKYNKYFTLYYTFETLLSNLIVISDDSMVLEEPTEEAIETSQQLCSLTTSELIGKRIMLYIIIENNNFHFVNILDNPVSTTTHTHVASHVDEVPIIDNKLENKTKVDQVSKMNA